MKKAAAPTGRQGQVGNRKSATGEHRQPSSACLHAPPAILGIWMEAGPPQGSDREIRAPAPGSKPDSDWRRFKRNRLPGFAGTAPHCLMGIGRCFLKGVISAAALRCLGATFRDVYTAHRQYSSEWATTQGGHIERLKLHGASRHRQGVRAEELARRERVFRWQRIPLALLSRRGVRGDCTRTRQFDQSARSTPAPASPTRSQVKPGRPERSRALSAHPIAQRRSSASAIRTAPGREIR